MLTKVLISCIFFAAVQAATSSYASFKTAAKPFSAGYVAQVQPAATLIILPSYGNGYTDSAAATAAATGSALASQSYASIYQDPEILSLIKLVFSLPSAGGPNAALINVPQYPTTFYTAPAVEISADNSVSSSSSAAAASNIKSVSSGFNSATVPASAHSAGSGLGAY